MALVIQEFSVVKLHGRPRINLYGDWASNALGELKDDEDDTILCQSGCRAAEGFKSVDLGFPIRALLVQRDHSFGADRALMHVTQLDDWQITFRKCRFAGQPLRKGTE